jgi:hypothetical protein
MEEKTEAAGGRTHAGGCFFCDTAMPVLENLVSESTRDHFRNSREEFLKGLRDEKISHLSREESRGTHVNVE